MVQFINLPQSARGKLSDSLGQSIGGGLANFTGNYFANKKLEEVLNDPSMKNAELSERQTRLQSALSPYGQYGQNVLQKRLGIEQQIQQEQEQKKQNELQKKKSAVFSKSLKNEPLTPEEELLLAPEEQLAIAKHKQALDIANLRKKNDVEETKNTAQTAFNEMAGLLKGGYLGLGSNVKGTVFGGKYAEDPAQFKSLSGALESLLKEMVSKGTLSNARFNYIINELLPKPSDREAIIRGKMKGLAKILGLDASELESEKNIQTADNVQNKRPGFVKMKDPQGIERWIPENVAQQLQGSQ